MSFLIDLIPLRTSHKFPTGSVGLSSTDSVEPVLDSPSSFSSSIAAGGALPPVSSGLAFSGSLDLGFSGSSWENRSCPGVWPIFVCDTTLQFLHSVSTSVMLVWLGSFG